MLKEVEQSVQASAGSISGNHQAPARESVGEVISTSYRGRNPTLVGARGPRKSLVGKLPSSENCMEQHGIRTPGMLNSNLPVPSSAPISHSSSLCFPSKSVY